MYGRGGASPWYVRPVHDVIRKAGVLKNQLNALQGFH
jgi:hypothetical protein